MMLVKSRDENARNNVQVSIAIQVGCLSRVGARKMGQTMISEGEAPLVLEPAESVIRPEYGRDLDSSRVITPCDKSVG